MPDLTRDTGDHGGGMTTVIPLFLCSRCYIRLTMSLLGAYRRMPAYLVIPLALAASALFVLMVTTLAVVGKLFLFQTLNGPNADDLGFVFFLVFFTAPAIAIFAFVPCFSLLINWHHTASWRIPTFAFGLSSILVWVWARNFGGIGFRPFIPGAIAWLTSCWFLHRRSTSPSEHGLPA